MVYEIGQQIEFSLQSGEVVDSSGGFFNTVKTCWIKK